MSLRKQRRNKISVSINVAEVTQCLKQDIFVLMKLDFEDHQPSSAVYTQEVKDSFPGRVLMLEEFETFFDRVQLPLNKHVKLGFALWYVFLQC